MLPAAVPVPAFFRAPGSRLPFGAIGYQRLPGQPCQPGTATETTAHDLGNFLAVLHQANVRKFPAMPGPEEVWEGWRKLRKNTELLLRRRMTRRENQRISRGFVNLMISECYSHPQALTRHARNGDFYPAKNADLDPVTSGDFFMATDMRRPARPA